MTEEERRESLRKKGVPPRFERFTLADFPDLAFGVSLDLPSKPPSVLIYGDTGRGKTALAAAIFRMFLPRCLVVETVEPDYPGQPLRKEHTIRLSALWLNVPRWLLGLRASFAMKAAVYSASVAEAVEASLLVLDDLGAERVTDWASETNYVVVSAREEYERPTIVTTNLGPEALRRWNPRLASRLMAYQRIHLDGPDRRIAFTEGKNA